jgi:hypothetical protein
VHEAAAVPVTHNFTLATLSEPPVPAVSFVNGEIVCVALYAPALVSGFAVGGGMTVGVYVVEAVVPEESVTE